MAKGKGWLLSAVMLAAALSGSAPAAEDESQGALPSRGRAAALLTSLFYYDAEGKGGRVGTPGALGAGRGMTEGTRIVSASPQRMAGVVERAKVVDFARSLVYEGGYYPKEIYQMMGYGDAASARIARLTRQLDRAENKRPSPWEVAGRVGRSGMNGSSDNWAMAPGETGEEAASSPGTLAYLPALAVAYAADPQSGREAAAQLAILKDDDLRAAPAARAAFSLLARILVSRRHDKDAWLRDASADSRDADTEQDLRAVRVKDWRYLRGEECAMGRLERAIYLWYKGDGYEEIMTEGRSRLRSNESLAYLAALSAVTYGMESLPRRVIANGASDRQLLDLINDLHDLATSEAVLRVEPEE